MLRSPCLRRFAVSMSYMLAACACASAQVSGLPPMSPTSGPNSVAPLSGSAQSVVIRARRADVRYANGLLSIDASNSSLNQILREIGRQTGMKITGGVLDERVFGHYGPASADVVLETLIDSNSTNVLLRHGPANELEELILTARSGGATPPNPNAPGFDDGYDAAVEQIRNQEASPQVLQPARRGAPTPGVNSGGAQPGAPASTSNPGSVPASIPPPANNVLGDPRTVSPSATTMPTTDSVSSDSISTPSTTNQIVPGIVDAPNPGTTNSGTDAPRTPEQIYEQLMRLRQQQQPQQTTPPK